MAAPTPPGDGIEVFAVFCGGRASRDLFAVVRPHRSDDPHRGTCTETHMSMTIGKRIILGFGATVAIIAGVGAFTYAKLRNIADHTDTVAEESLPGTYIVGQINALAAENFGRVLRHVII